MGRYNRILRLLSGIACSYFSLIALASSILINNTAADWSPRQIPLLFGVMYFHGALAALTMSVWLMSNRVRFSSWRAPRWCLLGLCGLGIVSLDMSLGVFYPPLTEKDSIFTPHPRRGWSHRISAEGVGDTNFEPVRTNRLGLRGPELPAKRAPNELRILIMGDSVTFGLGLVEAQTLSEKCRSAFSAEFPNRTITCLNGGTPGYTIWQELDLLQEIDERAQPNIVIQQFCINDVADVLNLTGKRLIAAPFTTVATGSTHWSGIARFLNAVIVQPRMNDWRDWNLWGPPINQRDKTDPFWNGSLLYAEPMRDDISNAWVRTMDDLSQVSDFCRSRRRVLVLAYFPCSAQLVSGELIDRPQRMLASWSKKNHVAFVDLTAALRVGVRDRAGNLSALMNDTVHMSELGNELIARELAKAVSDVLDPEK